MSLELYAEDSNGNIVILGNRLRSDTLEVSINAEEASVAESTILLDDPTANFDIRGLKRLYFVETDAVTDDWAGIIGPFYTWNRRISRDPGRSSLTSNSRVWSVAVKDINTLLTRRIQKGTDAKRPAETDVSRMQWLVGTPEVIGGSGDNPDTIDDLSYLFTDSPVQMDKTDYTGQDSAGVINDALQDSGKNAYLYNSPSVGSNIRIGIWYGRTERTDYSSPHRISNLYSDVDIDPAEAAFTMTAEDLIAGTWTFAPSIDSELDRDPSRVASGVMVQFDGGYAYERRIATANEFEFRDMLMQAELVKTKAQATRRALRYLRDLRDEDDAIETAVIVPSALINAFREGQRVQVKFTHLPGYGSAFVWMRIARRTVRQLSAASLLYELALDLRAENPPDTVTAACTGLTAAGTYYALGGSVDTPNPSDGVIYYWNPGEERPIEPADLLGTVGHWNFPQYSAGGAGNTDYAGDCAQNRVRMMVVGDGTMTIHTAQYGGAARTLSASVFHHRYGVDESNDPTSGVDILDATYTTAAGSDLIIPISTHGSLNCTHWVDLKDVGGTCGAKWGFTSMEWDPA